MNLTSRRARTLFVLCSVGAVVGAGVTATSALAAGVTLAFGPTGTSATIVDTDPSLAAPNPGLAYGLKVTGQANSDAMRLSVLSGPTGGSIFAEAIAANGAAVANPAGTAVTGAGAAAVLGTGTAGATSMTTDIVETSGDMTGHLIRIAKAGEPTEIVGVTAGGATTTLTLDRPLAAAHSGASLTDLGAAAISTWATTAVGTQSALTGYANTGNEYFGATVPGTYTFQLYQDHNGNGAYDSAQDDATPTFTLTVKDVTGATTSTSDDAAFAATVPSTVEVGRTLTASVAPGLTTVDTRGVDPAHNSVGALGYAISQAITLTRVGTNGLTPTPTSGHPVFDGASTYSWTSSTITHAGTATTTPTLAFTGTGTPFSGTAGTTTAADNLVTAVALAPQALQDTNVTITAAGAEKIRAGVNSVTYEATVTVSSGAKSGKLVDFTVAAGSGTTLADLTANGAAVPSTGIVTATTNASGVATLTVTSGKTADTNAYTVQAESNNIVSDADTGTGGNQPITATYTAAAAQAALLAASSTGNTSSVYTGTVTITGALQDQWGQVFHPAAGVQATLSVDQNQAGGFGAADYTHVVDIPSSGIFSSTYSDSTLTGARTDAYQWTVSAVDHTGGHIEWVANATPATVTLSTIGGHALPEATGTTEALSDYNTLSQSALVGTITDSTGTALKYADFTLSGSAGVYFIDSTGALKATLAARTDNAGQLQSAADQSGSDVKVVFTKAGTATITATSGPVTATSTANVAVSTDPYTVTVNNVTGDSGSVLVLTGTVTDMFGNPVGSQQVDLSTGTATLGALGNGAPSTNANGVFSTTYTTGSNQSGTATLTATIHGQAANVVPDTTVWTTTRGLTGLADGVYQATGTITVGAATPPSVSLSGTSTLTGAGAATLTGSTTANVAVDIYEKTTSGMILRDSVMSDSTGAFTSTVVITGTTTFIAKTADATSPQFVVTVTPIVRNSTASVTAVALGNGKVRLTGNGGPTRWGTLKFYRWVGSSWKLLAVSPGNMNADAAVVVSSPKGVQTFRAVYIYPGWSAAGGNARITVR
jgi:mucin-2